MSSLPELLNADSIIQFYEKYKDSTVNLLQISEREEISKPYGEGLLALIRFLDHMDVKPNRTFRKEIKKMFSGYHHFQIDNYKGILIMMYKFLNSHCVSNDVSDHELSIFGHFVGKIREIYWKHVRQSGQYISDSRVLDFVEDCCYLKFHQNSWNLGEIETNPPTSETSLMTINSLYTPSIQKPYIPRVEFFKQFGFFYPTVTHLNDSFFQNHINLLSMTGDDCRSTTRPSFVRPPKTKIDLINKFINYLESAETWFGDERLYFRTRREFPLDILNETVIGMDLTIFIESKCAIPAVIVRNNLKFMFENFQKTKNSNLTSSSEFIGLYSEALLNSILTKSRLSFISDGRFCIAILFNVDKLDNEDNISNIRRVPCEIITFDAEVHKMGVCFFILMVLFEYEDKLVVDDEKFEDLKKSLHGDWKVINRRTEKQYQVLDELSQYVSKVQQISIDQTMNDKVEEIENEIFEQWNIRINFRLLTKVMNTYEFRFISISELKVKSVLSGTKLYENYSTILETHDGCIYKVFDPVKSLSRFRLDIKYFTFYEKLKIAFDMFVREVSMYTYLEGRFKEKPTILEIGYISNPHKKYCKRLPTVKKNISGAFKYPLAGFYIKMTKVEGIPLGNSDITRKERELLTDIFEKLHSLDVIHGDVHGENFVYDESTESISVLDFGRSNYKGLEDIEDEIIDDQQLESLKRRDISYLNNLFAEQWCWR
ncbi:hypothetical protein DFJ63DRAFT_311395 [Scheffersomyces coipomensis]|uniref:uncharacterized protein n=1 Tax=Scheffersomyces coipomensis TaxID=1788519 RepID=UPI00315CBDB3